MDLQSALVTRLAHTAMTAAMTKDHSERQRSTDVRDIEGNWGVETDIETTHFNVIVLDTVKLPVAEFGGPRLRTVSSS